VQPPADQRRRRAVRRLLAENRRTYQNQKENLLEARARRIFDMTAAACEAGVYPYQVALEGRSGPWVRAEGRETLSLSAYDYLGLMR
jgi:hypothetical protein